MLRIGCHLPSSKGYLEMGKHAVALGATTFAFFTRNPRGGKAKPIQKEDVAAFLAYAAEHDLQHLVAHAPYTMNLCSADPSIRQFGKDMLADDLQRMEYTPNQYYNFHPGSHVKQGAEVGIAQIAETLNEVLFPEQTTTVLLETVVVLGCVVGCFFFVFYGSGNNNAHNHCHKNNGKHYYNNDIAFVFLFFILILIVFIKRGAFLRRGLIDFVKLRNIGDDFGVAVIVFGVDFVVFIVKRRAAVFANVSAFFIIKTAVFTSHCFYLANKYIGLMQV